MFSLSNSKLYLELKTLRIFSSRNEGQYTTNHSRRVETKIYMLDFGALKCSCNCLIHESLHTRAFMPRGTIVGTQNYIKNIHTRIYYIIIQHILYHYPAIT